MVYGVDAVSVVNICLVVNPCRVEVWFQEHKIHHSDVTMNAMASQISSVTIVYSTVCLDADKKKKTSKLRVTGLCEGNSPVTGKLPAQRASNAENVFIWWRHHSICISYLTDGGNWRPPSWKTRLYLSCIYVEGLIITKTDVRKLTYYIHLCFKN